MNILNILNQGHKMQQILALFQRCLKPEEYQYLIHHVVQDGAAGSTQFMNSESIVPIVQLLYSEYREFLKGNTK